MIRRVLVGLGALLGVLLAFTFVSKDFRRFVTMYADGSADALQGVDLTALPRTDQAAYLFLLGDFGALSTDTLRGSATPWKLTATVVTLDYVNGDASRLTRENMEAAFRQWGMPSPMRIKNWPDHLTPPELNAPLGITVGTVKRSLPSIELAAANLGCAACHASVVYDREGMPDPSKAWIGAPNGSINLEAYPQAILDGFAKYGDAPELFTYVETLFPEMSSRERKTLENFVLPRAVPRVKELQETTGRAVPFKGGYPGITNGFDALQIRLGLAPRDEVVELSAFNSIPNLEDHAFRTSFLNAANYEIPGLDPQQTLSRSDIDDAHLDKLGAIVAYFTVPSMGVDFATAKEQIPNAQTVMRFVADYETPDFPGAVDLELAERGSGVYEAYCASCHGSYEGTLAQPQLSSFPNHVSDVGTDGVRLTLLTPAFAKGVNRSAMGKHVHVPKVQGYSAPSLSGVWLSAPYLHNGSVPTLWSLMNPELRPVRFPIGGHRLDFETMGIALDINPIGEATYPKEYEPWSVPVIFDTRKPGLSNIGHEQPFDVLSQDEKRELLEYLKTL